MKKSQTNSKIYLTTLFKDFFESEKSGGIILLIATIISLVLANSGLGKDYITLWDFQVAEHGLSHWINDGLMTIFFLMIGLELEREIYAGELSNIKQASFPVIAAIGGMIVPALLFLAFSWNTKFMSGAGIPMATDIAFAVGILSLIGNRVPVSLKIFLTALAVVDDLGAILVIAIFYTDSVSWLHLGIALGIFGILLAMNRLKVKNLIPYLIGGIAMWYFMLHSSVHASISGVLLAFAIPFGDGSSKSGSYILQHFLHRSVAFFILPLFALANTAIVLESGWHKELLQLNSIGIFMGLVIGKPLGIFLFCFVASKLRISNLPQGLKWKHILGVGFLGGIGFTMSIFISLLAFEKIDLINSSKIAVLLSSTLAALIGFFILRRSFGARKKQHLMV